MRMIDADALSRVVKLAWDTSDSEDFEKSVFIAIATAPTIEPEPRWIPCSERLPEEDGGLYLVTDYSKSIGRRRRHISRCYMNKLGFWSDVPIGYEVVAWMPLPEPYVEKEIQ